jgi:hypothetical protein
MDNFFQVLIILIIIYSVFANILKKNKSEKTKIETPQDTKGEDPDDASPQYSEDYIFGDIFGNKLPRQEEVGQEKYKTSNLQTVIKEADQKEVEQSPVLKNDIPDQTYSVAPPIMVDVALPTNVRTLELKKKIKNPATLREFILISEILNKPKALRK